MKGEEGWRLNIIIRCTSPCRESSGSLLMDIDYCFEIGEREREWEAGIQRFAGDAVLLKSYLRTYTWWSELRVMSCDVRRDYTIREARVMQDTMRVCTSTR
jgi:hypothetical protein